MKILVTSKGGPGSGNWGHTGRPGLVGGSGGGGAGTPIGASEGDRHKSITDSVTTDVNVSHRLASAVVSDPYIGEGKVKDWLDLARKDKYSGILTGDDREFLKSTAREIRTIYNRLRKSSRWPPNVGLTKLAPDKASKYYGLIAKLADVDGINDQGRYLAWRLASYESTTRRDR